MRRLYIRFKSLVNDFVYGFGRAALLLLVEVYNHTVPVRERRRIRVKGTVRMKSPEKMENQQLFLFHDNAPAYRSDFTDDNLTTLEHYPYSPDLAATDFCLFPSLKLTLTGRRVCNNTDIIKNALEELKRFSKIVFPKFFQHFYSRWQNSIVVPGGLF